MSLRGRRESVRLTGMMLYLVADHSLSIARGDRESSDKAIRLNFFPRKGRHG